MQQTFPPTRTLSPSHTLQTLLAQRQMEQRARRETEVRGLRHIQHRISPKVPQMAKLAEDPSLVWKVQMCGVNVWMLV